MRDVTISGASMTRFGKFPDRSVRSLAEEATNAALQDAGIEARDVGMVFFANATAGLVTGLVMLVANRRIAARIGGRPLERTFD